MQLSVLKIQLAFANGLNGLLILNRLKSGSDKAWMRCNVQYIKTLSRSSENEIDEADTNLVKLPPPDKSSVDLIMQQFVRAISLTDDKTTAPDHINHWAHNDHPLKLFDQQIENKNTTEWFGANDNEMLHCDGCGRPISSGDLFYCCVICNYFLHKFCAERFNPKFTRDRISLDIKELNLMNWSCAMVADFISMGYTLVEEEKTFVSVVFPYPE